MVVAEELKVLITGDNADLLRSLDHAEGRMGRIGAAAQRATKAATIGLAGATAAAGLSVKAAIDFESAFAGVEKTVDGTAEELAGLEAGIRDMAKRLPASATEIAGVAEAAGQLGIETGSILGFTETMIALGETTNLTANQAAVSLARLANITGLPQDQFDNLGSSIVALGNNLATTEAEIVTFAERISGAGALAGLTEAQIVAIGGAMSSVGVQAEAGGTATQKVLNTMLQAVAQGSEELDTFAATAGLTTQEFADLFERDAGEAFTRFVEGLGAQGDDAFATLEALQLQDQRLIRSFLSLAGAGDLLRDSMDLSTEAFAENTALTKEAGQRYKTTAARLKVFKNRLTDVAIGIGIAFLPALEALLRVLEPVLRFLEEHKNVAVALITVIGTLSAAILAVSFATKAWGAVTLIAEGVVKAVRAAVILWTKAQWLLNVALNANPLGLLLILIGALIALIAVIVLKSDKLRERWVNNWQAIWEGMLSVLGSIGDWFQNRWDDVQAVFSGAFEWAAGIGRAIWDGITGALAGIGDWFEDQWKSVKDGTKRLLGISSPSKWAKGIGKDVTAGFSTGLDPMGDVGNMAFEDFTNNAVPGAQAPRRSVGVTFAAGAIQITVQGNGQDVAQQARRGVLDALSETERRWAAQEF